MNKEICEKCIKAKYTDDTPNEAEFQKAWLGTFELMWCTDVVYCCETNIFNKENLKFHECRYKLEHTVLEEV